MNAVMLILLLAPLSSAALIWGFCRQRHNAAAALSVTAAGIVALGTAWLLFLAPERSLAHASAQITWLQFGHFEVSLGFLLDNVTRLMLMVVAFVGFLIHLFSLGYMAHDAGKGRFFGGLSIFMFSMLGIVLADNLFMIFIFWELVGFSSYFLIGHYAAQDDAKHASKKAFIVNRVGDLGFLLGIILVFWSFGTTDLAALAALGPGQASTAVGLLLFCGVLGKSAQMPLHVWLPDAMAGPTPVSALIHAATMVAAGVFLLARTWFLYTPLALGIIAWIGVATAFSAALWAFAQRDIKKVLAYSTLSQLGYMVAAFGLGTAYGLAAAGDAGHGGLDKGLLYGAGAALFHLTTHAFFKALLFLGSGSVIHACHHEQDIFKMGGLLRRMPVTGSTFLVGVLAISGIPLLSGFFSKDAILYLALKEALPAFVVLAVTSLMTATYMGRLFVITFLGQPNSDAAKDARETGWVMWLPLALLAVGSVLGGYAFFYPAGPGAIIGGWVPHPHGATHVFLIVFSLAAAVLGLGFAWLFYGAGAQQDALKARASRLWALSRSRFYFDEVYGLYDRHIQQRAADFLAFLDLLLIAGFFVRGAAGLAALAGIGLRRLHSGRISAYVWWFFIGMIAFSLFALDWIHRP